MGLILKYYLYELRILGVKPFKLNYVVQGITIVLCLIYIYNNTSFLDLTVTQTLVIIVFLLFIYYW
jgi:hypothetical protein